MNATQKQLMQARPALRHIAPLPHFICWGYVLVNLILGVGMYFLYKPNIAPIAVADILSYQQWGIVYVGLALLTAFGLLTNNWSVTRKCQLLGLFVKSVWAIALIIRCIDYPATILITGVWIFFAYIQLGTYIYFLPRNYRDELNV